MSQRKEIKQAIEQILGASITMRDDSENPDESFVVAAAISLVNEIEHDVVCPIVAGEPASSAILIKRLVPLKIVEAITYNFYTTNIINF